MVDTKIINPFLDLYGLNGEVNSNEQQLVKNLVAEAISNIGILITYLPRTLQKEDALFGEDVLSSFTTVYNIPMYLENVDGFDGENEFLQKFGMTVNDKATMIVSTDKFKEITGMEKPLEGDLLYFPLSGGIFEIKFVEDEKQFYPLGILPQYKLEIELFVYSSEDIDTGITAIDDIINHSGEIDITNLINYSRDFSQWSVVGTPIITPNVGTGYKGNDGVAPQLTDDDPAALEGFTSNIRTIAAESAIPYLGYILIQKNEDETRFPVFGLSFDGGTSINPTIMLNTNTGDTTFVDAGNIATGGAINYNEDYWLLWILEYNNDTNITLVEKIFPAFSTTWGTQEVTAMGSIIIDQAQLEAGVTEPTIQVETDGVPVTMPYVPNEDGDNEIIESEADEIRDFSESNPFGDF